MPFRDAFTLILLIGIGFVLWYFFTGGSDDGDDDGSRRPSGDVRRR